MATERENTELSTQGAEANPVGPGVGTEAKAADDDPDVDNTPELCKDPRFVQLWVDTLEKVAIDPECELIPLMKHLRTINETTLVGYRGGKIRLIYDTHPTLELNLNYGVTAALGGAICSAFPRNIFLNRCGCLMRTTPEMIEIVDTRPRPTWPQTGSPRIRMAYDSKELEPDAPPGLSRKAYPCIPRTLKSSTLGGELEGGDTEEGKEERLRDREENSKIMEDIYHTPRSDTWYSVNELDVEEFSQRIPMDNERLESILNLLAPWKYRPQEWFYPDEKAKRVTFIYLHRCLIAIIVLEWVFGCFKLFSFSSIYGRSGIFRVNPHLVNVAKNAPPLLKNASNLFVIPLKLPNTSS